MSSVAAIFSRNPDSRSHNVAVTLLDRMAERGSDQRGVCVASDATLAQARFAWESSPADREFAVFESPDVAVVADASIYYRDDLARALGVTSSVAAALTPAELIARAYLALGDAMLNSIEGDFAFVLWEKKTRRVFAARDFVGQRPLYYFAHSDTLIIASTVDALLSHPAIRREVDLDTVAETAACLSRHSSRTCFKGILEMPAGHFFTWLPEHAVPGLRAFWTLPFDEPAGPGSIEDGSRELLDLLARAISERFDSGRPTAITLSGGWDSTAVYAVANTVLRRDIRNSRSLAPISFSYPEGDPGWEDDLIAETVSFWRGRTTWRHTSAVSVFGSDPYADAGGRSDASAHPFEWWNRELCVGAAAAGSRVVFSGAGGDQLFQVTLNFLSDLIRTGHFIEAVRQWQSRRAGDLRWFAKTAIIPALPAFILRPIESLTGRRFQNYLDREPPWWFRDEYIRTHGLRDRDRETRPAISGLSAVQNETHAALTFPFVGRIMSQLSAFALESGIEMRHPLLDARVVRFAARRPWYEKSDQRETKILLRTAMRGLLPERVLAPRATRTGLSSGFFVEHMIASGIPLSQRFANDAALADAGMVSPKALQRAWNVFAHTRDPNLAFPLYCTLQAEMWLRQHI